MKDYTLYLGNVSEDFTINNVKKTGLEENIYIFCSVDFNPNVTKGIHRYP